MTLETPESLLDFWIGDAATSPEAVKTKNKLWFRKAFATDALIAERFLPTLVALASGLAYDWAVASPRGRLAAIITQPPPSSLIPARSIWQPTGLC